MIENHMVTGPDPGNDNDPESEYEECVRCNASIERDNGQYGYYFEKSYSFYYPRNRTKIYYCRKCILGSIIPTLGDNSISDLLHYFSYITPDLEEEIINTNEM